MSGEPATSVVDDLLDLSEQRKSIGPGTTRLICIDGLAGAGKTTLAAALAHRAGVRGTGVEVVHMDDLYRGWGGLLEAGESLFRQVVKPLSGGASSARYLVFDWDAAAFRSSHEFAAPDLLIVEGCGSGFPPVAEQAGVVVFLDAPDDIRLTRGLARDGEAMRPQWEAFMASEKVLENRDHTRDRADVVLDHQGRVVRWLGEAG